METRKIGGVDHNVNQVRSQIGLEYAPVATVLKSQLATLGAPENSDVYVICSDAPEDGHYFWNQTHWENLAASQGLAIGSVLIHGRKGASFTPGAPIPITVNFATAYQAPDPTKPAFISAMVEMNYVTTLAGTKMDEIEMRIGPDATVANGVGGTRVSTARRSLTGIAVNIGSGTGDKDQMSYVLPTGWYFAFRRLSGTDATLSNATAIPLA